MKGTESQGVQWVQVVKEYMGCRRSSGAEGQVVQGVQGSRGAEGQGVQRVKECRIAEDQEGVNGAKV